MRKGFAADGVAREALGHAERFPVRRDRVPGGLRCNVGSPSPDEPPTEIGELIVFDPEIAVAMATKGIPLRDVDSADHGPALAARFDRRGALRVAAVLSQLIAIDVGGSPDLTDAMAVLMQWGMRG